MVDFLPVVAEDAEVAVVGIVVVVAVVAGVVEVEVVVEAVAVDINRISRSTGTYSASWIMTSDISKTSVNSL